MMAAVALAGLILAAIEAGRRAERRREADELRLLQIDRILRSGPRSVPDLPE
jgi:hypothetical protein